MPRKCNPEFTFCFKRNFITFLNTSTDPIALFAQTSELWNSVSRVKTSELWILNFHFLLYRMALLLLRMIHLTLVLNESVPWAINSKKNSPNPHFRFGLDRKPKFKQEGPRRPEILGMSKYFGLQSQKTVAIYWAILEVNKPKSKIISRKRDYIISLKDKV